MVRGALLPSAYASNIPSDNLKQDLEKDAVRDIKMAPTAEWYEDEANMKENDGDI